MRPKNLFEQFDEVQIISKHKNGVVVEYAFSEKYGVYNYLIDCEDEILTYSEQELRIA